MKLRNRIAAFSLSMIMLFVLVGMSAAASLTVNIKDSTGADFSNLPGVTIRVLDGLGGLVQEVQPTAVSTQFDNLSGSETYTLIVKYNDPMAVSQNSTVTVDYATTRTIKFASDTEALNRDIFLAEPRATNVLVRVTNVPTDWTSAKVVLTPVESTKFQVDAANLTFTMTPSNGTAEMTVPTMPSCYYTIQLQNQDGSATYDVAGTKRASTNGTLSFNTNIAKVPTISFVFTLKNPDRTTASFAGENIHIDVKDEGGAVVYTKDIVASGDTINDVTSTLANANYTVEATMSKAGETVTRLSSRSVSLAYGPKTSNIAFTTLSPITTDFLIKDSRTSEFLTTGQMVIKDANGNVVDTISLTGAPISKGLVYGYLYTIETTADGYRASTTTFYPRTAGVKEITLYAGI